MRRARTTHETGFVGLGSPGPAALQTLLSNVKTTPTTIYGRWRANIGSSLLLCAVCLTYVSLSRHADSNLESRPGRRASLCVQQARGGAEWPTASHVGHRNRHRKVETPPYTYSTQDRKSTVDFAMSSTCLHLLPHLRRSELHWRWRSRAVSSRAGGVVV